MKMENKSNEISIYRALIMKNSFRDRIDSAMNEIKPIMVKKSKNQKVNGKSDKEIETEIKASVQQVEDLIRNYDMLVRAITLSNAVTKVNICGEEMTVAEVLSRRQNDAWITFQKRYLRVLKGKYNNAEAENVCMNDALEGRFDKFLTALAGSDKKNLDPATVARHQEEFYAQNSPEIIDPCKIKDKIDTLNSFIDSFEEEVNAAIAESNARTMITVNFR